MVKNRRFYKLGAPDGGLIDKNPRFKKLGLNLAGVPSGLLGAGKEVAQSVKRPTQR